MSNLFYIYDFAVYFLKEINLCRSSCDLQNLCILASMPKFSVNFSVYASITGIFYLKIYLNNLFFIFIFLKK
jgi:nucleoside recognition membrane protein YjiH